MNNPDNMNPEILRAQAHVEQNRRALEDSIEGVQDSIDSTAHTIDLKKQETVSQVEAKLSEVQSRVQETIQHGETMLNEKFSQADEFFGTIGGQIEQTLVQGREIFLRVKTQIDETIQVIDYVARRFEDIVSTVRREFMENADQLFGRVEGVAQGFSRNVTSGTDHVRQIIDQAEGTLNRVTDPVQFVQKNPRAGIPVILVGGIFIGLFLRRAFVRDQQTTNTMPTVVPDVETTSPLNVDVNRAA